MRRARLLAIVGPSLLFASALVVRWSQHHEALLYPDGYQYLLMARGIGEHLQPTTVLGPGGDAFVPNADAGVKPFFPLAVAAVHAVGMSWLEAAKAVTVLAGASVVTVVALLVTRLGGAAPVGLAAGVLVLASPSVGFWSGFSGPDQLALALGLGAALAFAYERPREGGVLIGLAIATRPELALLAVAAAALSLGDGHGRRQLRSAAPAALAAGGLVFAVLRTPIVISDWRLAWFLPVSAVALLVVGRVPDGALRLAGAACVGVAAVVLATNAGPQALWQDDWPLLMLGAAGAVLLLVVEDKRTRAALILLGGVLLLGSVYLVKNPGVERYFAALLPAVAILVGLAASRLTARVRAVGLAAMALVAAVGFMHPVPGSRDFDMFPMVADGIAGRLERSGEPLITAAPDAYGFWLPDRAVRGIRRGARGAILLDAAQRLYAPRLGARGAPIARVDGDIAFARPDLEIDADPAVLVRGEVVVAASG